jgi:hypothetical protein
MRGTDEQTGALFSYLSPDALVPRDHPLRSIRPLVDTALEKLSPHFETLYASGGRTSIARKRGKTPGGVDLGGFPDAGGYDSLGTCPLLAIWLASPVRNSKLWW